MLTKILCGGLLQQTPAFFNKNKFNMQALILNQFKSPRIVLKMIFNILTIKTIPQ